MCDVMSASPLGNAATRGVDHTVYREPSGSQHAKLSPEEKPVSKRQTGAQRRAELLAAGKRFDLGRYHVVGILGSGGTAVVYRAYDTLLKRSVALKLVQFKSRPNSESSKKSELHEAQVRMARDARSLAKLGHPNIVSLYDVGLVAAEDSGNTPGLNSFVDSVTSLEILQSLSNPDLGGQPSLALTPGPQIQAFQESSMHQSSTGRVMGTPRYMAPEQALGMPCRVPSDVFLFALSLYESLLGRHPLPEHRRDSQTRISLAPTPAA